MLVGFSVSNYKSFKDGQTISFEASKIVRHKSHVAVKKNKRILNFFVIFCIIFQKCIAKKCKKLYNIFISNKEDIL